MASKEVESRDSIALRGKKNGVKGSFFTALRKRGAQGERRERAEIGVGVKSAPEKTSKRVKRAKTKRIRDIRKRFLVSIARENFR